MDDVGVLCAEPIRIALATQNVAALFDAYDKELRVIVLAASGKHPEPPGGGAAGSPFTVPIGIDGVHTKAATDLVVSTPWEEAVLELLADDADPKPCIDTSGERVRQVILELPYDLEPLTDYLIDIHAVPKGSPAGARGLVYRVGFTTSGSAPWTSSPAWCGSRGGGMPSSPPSRRSRRCPTRRPATCSTRRSRRPGCPSRDAERRVRAGAVVDRRLPRSRSPWSSRAPSRCGGPG